MALVVLGTCFLVHPMAFPGLAVLAYLVGVVDLGLVAFSVGILAVLVDRYFQGSYDLDLER